MKHNTPDMRKLGIKCAVSNQLHKILKDTSGYSITFMTDAQAKAMLLEIVKMNGENSFFLRKYLKEKRNRKQVHEIRLKNGYYEKKAAKKTNHKSNLSLSKIKTGS